MWPYQECLKEGILQLGPLICTRVNKDPMTRGGMEVITPMCSYFTITICFTGGELYKVQVGSETLVG